MWIKRHNTGHMVASFDFDDTMTVPEYISPSNTWRTSLLPNLYTISEMARLAADDWKILVVVARHRTPLSMKISREFIQQYEIHVDQVVFSGNNFKTELLQQHNVSLHFDDDPIEIIECIKANITAIQVAHPAD